MRHILVVVLKLTLYAKNEIFSHFMWFIDIIPKWRNNDVFETFKMNNIEKADNKRLISI